MMKLSIFVLFGMTCTCLAQKQYTTPVPILKQINRHNEDGSYSYGFEAADGSFKIETKSASGEVKGKYGYVDDSGNVREIEYGANKNGFQASGDGIQAAPPAQDNSNSAYPPLNPGEIDDGQYREDPLMYNDPRYNSKPGSKAQNQFRINAAPAVQQPRPAYSQSSYKAPQQPAYRVPQQPTYREPQQQQQTFYENQEQESQSERPYYQSRFSAPAPAAQPNYYQPQPNYYRPANNYYQHPDQVNIFEGHPATNLDLSTGSYTVTYG